MVFLDANGDVYRTKKGYSMGEQHVKIESNCADVQVDAERIYVKKLIDNGADVPPLQYCSIDPQTLEVKVLSEDFEWHTDMDDLGPLDWNPPVPKIGGAFEAPVVDGAKVPP